jgi:DNA-binding CsgD family transcriptional regulator
MDLGNHSPQAVASPGKEKTLEVTKAGARNGVIGLTDKQREIIELVAVPLTRKEIAPIVNLSSKTVEFHVDSIRKKLGLTNDAELIRWALENGYATAAKSALSVTPAIVKNVDQLVDVLFKTCEDAANGVANAPQSMILCQCAGRLIDVFRLKMEFERRGIPIKTIKNKKTPA